MPSPVAQHALDCGLPTELIFTPERAGEEMFLSNLRALQPELCVTAAYGNILPTKFLKIPSLGLSTDCVMNLVLIKFLLVYQTWVAFYTF